MLELQFDDAGCGVVGIQEGRSKHSQVIAGTYYDMHVAAANKAGSYGVQLWVHHTLRYKQQGGQVHSPRLLSSSGFLVKYNIDANFIVAHAPHEHDV